MTQRVGTNQIGDDLPPRIFRTARAVERPLVNFHTRQAMFYHNCSRDRYQEDENKINQSAFRTTCLPGKTVRLSIQPMQGNCIEVNFSVYRFSRCSSWTDLPLIRSFRNEAPNKVREKRKSPAYFLGHFEGRTGSTTIGGNSHTRSWERRSITSESRAS